jgi:hypothetical protein
VKCTVQSWVGSFSLAPHVVHVGGKITEHGAPLIDHCFQFHPCFGGVAWALIGTTNAKHCHTDSHGGACQFTMTAPTVGWQLAVAGISNPLGSATGSD